MDSNPTFSSAEHRQLGDYPLRCVIAGRRFDSVKLRLSYVDYLDPRVQEWIAQSLMTRCSNPRAFRIHMEILP